MHVRIARFLEKYSHDRRSLENAASSARLQEAHDVTEIAGGIEREIGMALRERRAECRAAGVRPSAATRVEVIQGSRF